MLAEHRKSVCLSLVAFDLPVWSVVQTDATLYQSDRERYHVLLTEPLVKDFVVAGDRADPATIQLAPPTPRLLWLEVSPYRVIMTMQGNGLFSYRHFWEQGVYGISRYWLQSSSNTNQFRLRNFTRHLLFKSNPTPSHLRIEYELWSATVQVGRYVINLEIH